MEFRILGKTDIKVSEIGCGGIPLQKLDNNGTKELINELINQGINFIDSARGYNASEKLIGEAIKGIRGKFYLATKSMARDYESMKKDIEISLNNFQTNYIDLYQMHNVPLNCDISGALKALVEAKKEGKINHIGITSHTYEVIENVIDNPGVIETIQFPYNIIENKAKELFAKAKLANLGVIVMKPFAGGHIENKKVAMKFLLNDENISVAIPGMEDKMQVIENTSVKKGEYLKDEIAYIEELKKECDNDFCRRCGYCKPCTVGIDIPSCFTFESYHEKYGLEGWAIDRYNSMQHHASECIECHKCEERCPYKLNIVKKLKHVKETFGK